MWGLFSLEEPWSGLSKKRFISSSCPGILRLPARFCKVGPGSAIFDHVTPSEPPEPATHLPSLSSARTLITPCPFCRSRLPPSLSTDRSFPPSSQAALLGAQQNLTAKRLADHRPSARIKTQKTVVPRSTHPMLLLTNHLSVWTPPSFWKDSGCI